MTQSVPGRYRGFEWERRAIPPELVAVRDGVRIAAPAVSVLDLIPALGGAVIDEALRRGAVTLGELTAALKALGRRPGNALRTELLRDSRDEPWSEAERAAHRLLRAEGLTGWRTNRSVRALGADYVVDIVFRTQRVVIEIDGWQFHGDREAFRRDRWRYARLAAGGWTVLPFAAAAVQEEPAAFIEVVRAALEGGEF